MPTDAATPALPSRRGATLEAAAVAALALATIGVKVSLHVEPSVWSSAIDAAWQLPLLLSLWRLGLRRGDSLDRYSEALTRSAVWDIVLLFLAGSGVYAATYRLLDGLIPALEGSAWNASPRVVHSFGALPALALAVAVPLLSEALFRGVLQTRLRQLRCPATVLVLASAALQTSVFVERGLLPTAAAGAQCLVFAVYYHRSHRLWPVMIAHAMQSGIGLAALSRQVY